MNRIKSIVFTINYIVDVSMRLFSMMAFSAAALAFLGCNDAGNETISPNPRPKVEVNIGDDPSNKLPDAKPQNLQDVPM